MHKYDLVVMGFLNDRPMHGYQIKREVKTHEMDSWARINPPMIYQTIDKLEKNGMIRNSKVEREGRMPQRRVYRLTSKGKKRLAQLVEKSLMGKDLTNDLSNLAYFFILALSKDRALECLKERRDLAERIVQGLGKRLDEFRDKTSVNRFLVIEKDIERFKSEISYLKDFIKRVDTCENWKADAFI